LSLKINYLWKRLFFLYLKRYNVENIIKEVGSVVALWHQKTSNFKIKKEEIDRMSSAFEHEDL
jgi:hypothetical protein